MVDQNRSCRTPLDSESPKLSAGLRRLAKLYHTQERDGTGPRMTKVARFYDT